MYFLIREIFLILKMFFLFCKLSIELLLFYTVYWCNIALDFININLQTMYAYVHKFGTVFSSNDNFLYILLVLHLKSQWCYNQIIIISQSTYTINNVKWWCGMWSWAIHTIFIYSLSRRRENLDESYSYTKTSK